MEELFRRALATAQAQGARSFALRAATSLGRLLGRGDRGAEARAVLEPIYDAFTEGHDTADLVDARALLESLGRPSADRDRDRIAG